jgi:hypothetical protein
LRGEGITHHVADIMGDEVAPLDLELVKNARDVATLRFLVVAIFGMRREAHPAQVRNDDRVIVHQRRRQGCPHVSGVAEAVQTNDRRSLATDPDVDRRAIGCDLLGAETGREFLNPCHVALSTTHGYMSARVTRLRMKGTET